MGTFGYLLLGAALVGAATHATRCEAQSADAAQSDRGAPLIIPDYDLGTMTSLAVLDGKCARESERPGSERFECDNAVVLLHRESAGGDASIIVWESGHPDQSLSVTGMMGSDDVVRLRYALPKPGHAVHASGTCRLNREPRATGVSVNAGADRRSGNWSSISCTPLDAQSGQPLFRFGFDAFTVADRRRRQMAANAAGKGRHEEIDYAPPSCAEGTEPPYPAFGGGLVETYQFQSESELANLPSIMEAVQNDHAFVTYWIGAGGETVLTVHPNDTVATPAQIDGHLRRLCAILTPLGFDIAHLTLRTVDEERRVERAKWAEARAFHRENPFMNLPDEQTVATLVESRWVEEYQYDFGLGGAAFARIRDFRCRYTEGRDPSDDHITCTVGVLATSKRGPEYEQRDLDFTRGLNGNAEHEMLFPYEPQIVIGPSSRTRH